MQVEVAEVELGVAIPQTGGAVEPHRGLGIALVDAISLGVADAEVELRAGMSLLGGPLIPLYGPGMALEHAAPGRETAGQRELGLGVAGLGALPQLSQGGQLVVIVIVVPQVIHERSFVIAVPGVWKIVFIHVLCAFDTGRWRYMPLRTIITDFSILSSVVGDNMEFMS